MVKKSQKKTRNKQTKSMAKKKKKQQHFNFKKNQPGEFYHKTIAEAWDKNKTLQQNYAAMGLVMDVNTAVNDKMARVLTRKLQSGALSEAMLAAGATKAAAADDDDDDDDDDDADAGAAAMVDDTKSAAKPKAKAKAKASGSSAGAAAAAAGAKGAKAAGAAGAAAKVKFPFRVMPQELSDIVFDSDDDEDAGAQSDAEVELTGNAKVDAAAKIKAQKRQIAKELKAVQKASAVPLAPYVAKTMPVHEQQLLLQLKRKYGSDFSKMARDTTINVHQKTEAQLKKRMALYDQLLAL